MVVLPASAKTDLKSHFHSRPSERGSGSGNRILLPFPWGQRECFSIIFLHLFHFFPFQNCPWWQFQLDFFLFQNVWWWGLSPHKLTCASPRIPLGHLCPLGLYLRMYHYALILNMPPPDDILPYVARHSFQQSHFCGSCFKHATEETRGSPLIFLHLHLYSQSSIPYNLRFLTLLSSTPTCITAKELLFLTGLLVADLPPLWFIMARLPGPFSPNPEQALHKH